MAGTYTQIYIQLVLVVKGRQFLIHPAWKDDLHKFICGIIKNKGHKCIIVNGMPDHVHVFVGLKPSMSISDLARDIKNNSSRFINQNKLCKRKFAWQAGFGAFSYSHSAVSNVYRYIQNQEEHHKDKTITKEYMEMLEAYDVDFNKKYLFD